MRRLLALAVPIALMMGTGCVAHVHGPAHHVPVDVIEYSYSSDHPIPDDYGGGWCPYSHVHVHEYQPTTTYYVYSDNAYYYQGPSVVWYWNDHPHAHGGICNLRGRHSHDYYPTVGNLYRYERNRGYVWSRTHSASAGYGYVRPATRPARPGMPGNTYGGTRSPPGGRQWSTQPSRSQGHSSNGSWGNRPGNTRPGNTRPSSSAPPPGRSFSGSSSSNSGSGRNSPPAGRPARSNTSRDDDDKNPSGNRWGSSNGSSSNSGSSSSGSSSSGSGSRSSSSGGWGRGNSSSGSSSSGSSSGGGWGRGGSSGGGKSSSGSGSPPPGRSGSSSGNGRWR
ncbi:hypothetical protein [Myxococcus sp. Y35]|uniref:hypothetical protein n=1 Tax=Pseudomyxococcus flavus TaxID=3115648 RepID=UPI003CF94D16